MLSHHHASERRPHRVAAQRTRLADAGAERLQLLLGIRHRDLRLAQSLARLQVILFWGDPLLPERFLACVSDFRRRQALLCAEQLAAPLGKLGAGDHRQHLALLDPLPEFSTDGFHNAREARNHVGGAILIEADLARQLDRALDLARLHRRQRNAGSLDLRPSELDLARLRRLLAVDMLTSCAVMGMIRRRRRFGMILMTVTFRRGRTASEDKAAEQQPAPGRGQLGAGGVGKRQRGDQSEHST